MTTYYLCEKATGTIVDPRAVDFPLSPADLGGFDNWDEALSAHRETDAIDGYEVIAFEGQFVDEDGKPVDATGYSIDHYFDRDGNYLGADSDGIRPLLAN